MGVVVLWRKTDGCHKYKMNQTGALMSQTFKQFLESDSRGILPYELAIRKELKASSDQAGELVKWLADEKDWFDLDFDARDVILDKWDFSEVNRVKHAGMSYSDYVMDKLADLLRDKYNLNARDLI